MTSPAQQEQHSTIQSFLGSRSDEDGIMSTSVQKEVSADRINDQATPREDDVTQSQETLSELYHDSTTLSPSSCSEQAITEFCTTISPNKSNGTSLFNHHLQIGLEMMYLLENNKEEHVQHLFATAMRDNTSLSRFTCHDNPLTDTKSKVLLQALAEKPKLIKDFDISCSSCFVEDEEAEETTTTNNNNNNTNKNQGRGGNILDLAIIPMLESNSWVGGLSFICSSNDSSESIVAPHSLTNDSSSLKSFFTALGRNTSLKSLEFTGFLSFLADQSILGNLWEALQQNTTLESLRFVSWSSSGCNPTTVQFPDHWEHDFVFSVLPNLSVIELELPAMKLPEDELQQLWTALTSNERLERLSIADIRSIRRPEGDSKEPEKVAWEHSFVTALPFLSLRELYLPNFEPNVVGWDNLLESVKKNVHLETFECSDFWEIKWSCRRHYQQQQQDYDKERLNQLDRFLLLNKAGRRIESAANRNPGLCPAVLDRINRLLLVKQDAHNDNNDCVQMLKADVIYDFLQGPFFNPILVANSHR